MVAHRLGINGFGSIGRRALRIALSDGRLSGGVMINHTQPTALMAHLLAHDSTYGPYPGTVAAKADALIVDGVEIPVSSERDPARIPWGRHGVGIVLECTGKFRRRAEAAAHLAAGARLVVISAPAKDDDLMVIYGVNHSQFDPARHEVISAGSCTTNALVPVLSVLLETFGVARGLLTTVHSFTRDQALVDGSHRDLRRARGATQSIIPTSTGAAEAVRRVLPELDGLVTGLSLRVPTPAVSIVDLSADLVRPADAEAVNSAFRDAATGRLAGVLAVEDAPLVSIDFRANAHSAVVDSALTMSVGPMVKVMAWYDNEWGYATRLIDLAVYLSGRL